MQMLLSVHHILCVYVYYMLYRDFNSNQIGKNSKTRRIAVDLRTHCSVGSTSA